MASEEKQSLRDKLAAFAKEKNLFFLPSIALSFGMVLLFSLMMLAFRLNLIVLIVIFGVFGIISALFFNVELEDKTKKIGFGLWRATISFLVTSAITTPVMLFFRTMMEHGSGNAVSFVPWLLFFIIAAGTIIFWISDTGKKMMEKVKEFNITSGSSANKIEHAGDVVLCKVKETGQPEIWPYKDRFLHMLILGPTGSGKTSQVILPLINQDMQNMEAGITVLEPKGDLAQKAAMMAKHYGRPFMYFDPSLADCPHFNPMAGKESDVVENMATTFRMLNPDSPQFFLDLNEQLMRNAVKVLKRLDQAEGIDGKWANLINLGRLLQNSGGQGRDIIMKHFAKIPSPTPDIAKENADIASWFLNDYLSERSKVYENTSGVRSQVAKITSNEFLREVLNPDVENGQKNDIDFDKHLAEGGVICISTAQGTLRDLSKFLGYFITLQLQSAVFRRPGNENTRRAHFLYIDEFQTYANPGFSDMLTQGRSYRVASHLATQARAQIGMGSGRDGDDFVQLVSTNARNIVLYPGCSYEDAKYYSDQFGEYMKEEVQVGITRKKFNLLTGGLDKLGHPSEQVRKTEKLAAVFTPTDLIYRPFGEIVYCLIKNNSIQIPQVGQISYIPQDLNKQLDEMVDQYLEEHKKNALDPWAAMRQQQEAARAAKAAAVQQSVIQETADIVPPVQAPQGVPVQPVSRPQQPAGFPPVQQVVQQPVQPPRQAPQQPRQTVVQPPQRQTIVQPPRQTVVRPPVQQSEVPDLAPVEPLIRPAAPRDVRMDLARAGDGDKLDLGFDDPIEDDDMT